MPTQTLSTDTSLLDALISDDPRLSWIFWSWKVLGDVYARQQVMQGLNTLMAGDDEIIVQTWEHPFEFKTATTGDGPDAVSYPVPDVPDDFPRSMEATWTAFLMDDSCTRPLWAKLGFRASMRAAREGRGICLFKDPNATPAE